MTETETVETPLTTKEAIDLYQCEACAAGNSDYCRNPYGDCVEDRTCSCRCTECGERIWFHGSWGDSGTDAFLCPYCGEAQVSHYRTYNSKGSIL